MFVVFILCKYYYEEEIKEIIKLQFSKIKKDDEDSTREKRYNHKRKNTEIKLLQTNMIATGFMHSY